MFHSLRSEDHRPRHRNGTRERACAFVGAAARRNAARGSRRLLAEAILYEGEATVIDKARGSTVRRESRPDGVVGIQFEAEGLMHEHVARIRMRCDGRIDPVPICRRVAAWRYIDRHAQLRLSSLSARPDRSRVQPLRGRHRADRLPLLRRPGRRRGDRRRARRDDTDRRRDRCDDSRRGRRGREDRLGWDGGKHRRRRRFTRRFAGLRRRRRRRRPRAAFRCRPRGGRGLTRARRAAADRG